MEGERFLKQKFNLQKDTEVQSAERRSRVLKGEKVEQTAEAQIENYLARFQEIIDRTDEKERERGLNALKKILHDTHVINFLPEEHIELARRIAREQGRGAEFPDDIDDEMREQMLENIRKDQTESLDAWVDELAQTGDEFPAWAKYWAIRSMLKMGTYDKEKARFNKRTAKTTAPFPELNQAALARTIDYVKAHIDGEELPNPSKPGENEFAEERQKLSDEDYQKILSTEDFAKYYAMVLQYEKSNEQLFHITDGEWRIFEQGSSGEVLSEAIQGHGTGWCTAGMDTANTQLQQGDFHIYFSKNELGAPIISRIAILMKGDEIDEVRGVAHKQEVDSYITPVLEEKLQEFGHEGEQYKQQVEDMKMLTVIDHMQENGEELSDEQLRFIYEIDRSIQGFGYQRDPRIFEIRNKRNQVQDYRRIYKEYIDQDTDSRFVAKLLEDEEDEFVSNHIKDFRRLDTQSIDLLVARFGGHIIISNYESFAHINSQTLVDVIIEHHDDAILVLNLDKFPKEERLPIAKKLITSDSSGFFEIEDIGVFLRNFDPSEQKEIFYCYMQIGQSRFAAKNFKEFEGIGSTEIDELIKAGEIYNILSNRERFPVGSYNQELAFVKFRESVRDDYTYFLPVPSIVASNERRFQYLYECFPKVDQYDLLETLLKFVPDSKNSLQYFVESLGSNVVHELLKSKNMLRKILLNFELLSKDVSVTELFQDLVANQRYEDIAEFLHVFPEIDESWLLEKLRNEKGLETAARYSQYFKSISPFDIILENVTKHKAISSLFAAKIDFNTEEQKQLFEAVLHSINSSEEIKFHDLIMGLTNSGYDKRLFLECYLAHGRELELIGDNFYRFEEESEWLREQLESRDIEITDEAPEEDDLYDSYDDYNHYR